MKKSRKDEVANREFELNGDDIRSAIHAQSEAEGYRTQPEHPITTPVLAEAHTPSYKMHRYYARRPHNVFASLIKHYTLPGDQVLDPFCGGGVTVVESLKLRRKVVGVDLNPLATWITRAETEPLDLDSLEALFEMWFSELVPAVRPLYEARCPSCKGPAIISRWEWSNSFICGACGEGVVVANTVKVKKGSFKCTNTDCGSIVTSSNSQFGEDVPIRKVVFCDACGKESTLMANVSDLQDYRKICSQERKIVKQEKLSIPQDAFPDMDRARDDNIFARGVVRLTDLMTARQRIAMARIRSLIPEDSTMPAEVDALWLVFSSLLRFTNKFVFQAAGWQSGKPIEWAGHNYWMPFQYIELNPTLYIKRRYLAVKAGKVEQQRQIGSFCKFARRNKAEQDLRDNASCLLLTQSSHRLPFSDHFFDAIITDPPFGGNVQYGELSDFYLCWIKDHLGISSLPSKDNEAIETRNTGFDGAKDRDFYENMLYRIFKECRRVIKPTGWLVMTFHNREIGVWMALHRAAMRAGFRLPKGTEAANRGMLYQPPVENYTQTFHQRAAGSMLGDFVLSFRPSEPMDRIDSIRAELSTEEESGLQKKVEELITFHGGADETTIMTGLIPYLHEQSLLHRLAKYDLKLLLSSGPFVYVPKEKKWFCKDMITETGEVRLLDHIPAETSVQELVYSFLSENKQASIDQLLVLIYESLVNSHRPQMSAVENVLARYCTKVKRKGHKRQVFVWNKTSKTPSQISAEILRQGSLELDVQKMKGHNDIIAAIARSALSAGCVVHVGRTEQRKSSELRSLSAKLTGLELGLPMEAFKAIREIDLLVLKGNFIVSAIEVATSINTFNKAINDRFRNLISLAPNLSIPLAVVVTETDLKKAQNELYTPANKRQGLSNRVKILTVDQALSLLFE